MIVRLVATAALLALLIWTMGRADIAARLGSIDPGWIALSVALLWVQTALMAVRWRLVARSLGIGFPVAWAIREYLLAQLGNATLPGGVAGDGARAFRSRIGVDGLRRAALAILCERAFGQVGLAAVAVLGLVGTIATPGAVALPGATLAWIAAALGLLSAVALVIGWRGGRISRLLSECLPDARLGILHAGLSLAAALLNVAAFALCARATGTDLAPSAGLLIVPLILFAMVVPLAIAGWGWREGAAALLFPLAGASAEAGIAAGIAFGIAMLLSVLPAVPMLLFKPTSALRDLRAAG